MLKNFETMSLGNLYIYKFDMSFNKINKYLSIKVINDVARITDVKDILNLQKSTKHKYSELRISEKYCNQLYTMLFS